MSFYYVMDNEYNVIEIHNKLVLIQVKSTMLR